LQYGVGNIHYFGNITFFTLSFHHGNALLLCVNLTFCNVLNTNCNLNPSIEAAHGEMTVFRKLALHLIHLNLTTTVRIC